MPIAALFYALNPALHKTPFLSIETTLPFVIVLVPAGFLGWCFGTVLWFIRRDGYVPRETNREPSADAPWLDHFFYWVEPACTRKSKFLRVIYCFLAVPGVLAATFFMLFNFEWIHSFPGKLKYLFLFPAVALVLLFIKLIFDGGAYLVRCIRKDD